MALVTYTVLALPSALVAFLLLSPFGFVVALLAAPFAGSFVAFGIAAILLVSRERAAHEGRNYVAPHGGVWGSELAPATGRAWLRYQRNTGRKAAPGVLLCACSQRINVNLRLTLR